MTRHPGDGVPRGLGWASWALSLLLAAALLSGCGTAVVNPVTGEAERSAMDEAAEIEVGRQAHQQVLAEQGRYPDSAVQAYVNGVGQKLAAQSHRAQLKWTFTVLDSPEVNAFALPGGYVYVTRGILAYLESEAELAGVIGHEIGHVTARHGAQRATRQQNAGIGVMAATVFGALLEGIGVPGATDLFGRASQGLAAGYVASYSREQELQADRLGAEYLVRNRYDPQNMAEVIGVLKGQERFAAEQAKAEGRQAPSGSHWLSSHPSNDRRLEDIRRIAATYPQADWSDDGRARYLRAVDGLTFGDSRSQGVTRGRHFFHEELGIALTAPPLWRVVNSAESISVVNPEGDAALVLRSLPASAGATHEEILRTLVQPVDGRRERRNLNGLPATHFEGTRQVSQNQQQSVSLTLVTGPGQRQYLIQHAARDAQALKRSASGLGQAEASFRPLSVAERSAARPWSLRTVPLPRGGWAELARSSPLPSQPEAQLRLLNGLYNGAREPRPGEAVKVVR